MVARALLKSIVHGLREDHVCNGVTAQAFENRTQKPFCTPEILRLVVSMPTRTLQYKQNRFESFNAQMLLQETANGRIVSVEEGEERVFRVMSFSVKETSLFQQARECRFIVGPFLQKSVVMILFRFGE